MNRFFAALSLLFVTVIAWCGPGDKLAAGPMQGHTTATSTNVWIMVQGKGTATLALLDATGKEVARQDQETGNFKGWKDYVPLTFRFSGLQPNTTYKASITFDGDTYTPDTPIKTLDDNPEKPYQFIVTSCALSVPVGLKWLHPGIEDRIYKYVAETPSEFTLWLGDYLYYLPKSTRSIENMYKRWTNKRLHNHMMKFIQSQPQYAIYDDHDYGPNDCGAEFVWKKESLQIFKEFFPNPYPENAAVPGVFFNFRYKDSEFFMTDDRYHRTETDSENPVMLGAEQLQWLKDQLLKSDATFKFVGVGSQVLNTCSANECYWYYEDEVKSLLDFVMDNKIEGVVFLSGDRHHSELLKMDDYREGQYPFYEFTSSGITSFRRRTRRTKENVNPHRVDHLLADYQNYGRISINGPLENRTCTFEVFNNRGKLAWTYTISANDLKFNTKTINVNTKPQDR